MTKTITTTTTKKKDKQEAKDKQEEKDKQEAKAITTTTTKKKEQQEAKAIATTTTTKKKKEQQETKDKQERNATAAPPRGSFPEIREDKQHKGQKRKRTGKDFSDAVSKGESIHGKHWTKIAKFVESTTQETNVTPDQVKNKSKAIEDAAKREEEQKYPQECKPWTEKEEKDLLSCEFSYLSFLPDFHFSVLIADFVCFRL